MEELIFIAIIVIFSVIDSIGRSRKKKRQAGGSGEASRLPEEQEWEDEPETYDQEPSYDDRYGTEKEPAALPGYTQPYGSSSGGARTTRTSSEGMIPSDIWEEIAGLSTGRTPARQAEPPPPPPPLPVEVESIPRRPVETHRVHRAHVGYGTDPSSRARSEQDGLDPLARSMSADVKKVRRQLRQGRHALRRAVILQEVLGPPASIRPERFPE